MISHEIESTISPKKWETDFQYCKFNLVFKVEDRKIYCHSCFKSMIERVFIRIFIFKWDDKTNQRKKNTRIKYLQFELKMNPREFCPKRIKKIISKKIHFIIEKAKMGEYRPYK